MGAELISPSTQFDQYADTVNSLNVISGGIIKHIHYYYYPNENINGSSYSITIRENLDPNKTLVLSKVVPIGGYDYLDIPVGVTINPGGATSTIVLKNNNFFGQGMSLYDISLTIIEFN